MNASLISRFVRKGGTVVSVPGRVSNYISASNKAFQRNYHSPSTIVAAVGVQNHYNHHHHHNGETSSKPWTTWFSYLKTTLAVSLVSGITISNNKARSEYEKQASSPTSTSTSTSNISIDIGSSEENVSITEKISGVSFPPYIIPSMDNKYNLLGASCRLMRQLVQVYAVGLYLDINNNSDTIQSLKQSYSTFSISDLTSNANALWSTLSSPSTSKTFRIVVVRQVAGSHMGSGFQRALLSRATQYSSDHGGNPPSKVKKSVKEFCNAFSKVGTMKIGSVADIVVEQNDSVKLIVDGRCICVINEKALAWALADMYLGEASVVPTFREQVAQGVVDLLKQQKQ